MGKFRLKFTSLYDKEAPAGVARTKTWKKSADSSRKTDQVSLCVVRWKLWHVVWNMPREFMLRVLAMFVPPLVTNEHKQELVLDEVRDNRMSTRGLFAERKRGET